MSLHAYDLNFNDGARSRATPGFNTDFSNWDFANNGLSQPDPFSAANIMSGFQGITPGLPAAPNLNFGAPGGGGNAPPGMFSMESMFGGGGGGGDGWATNGVNALSGLSNAWTGIEQLNLSEDIFDFQSNAFNTNLANEAKLINAQLGDRQSSRISSTGNNNAAGNYDSLDSYLAKNSVSGAPI